MRKDIQIRPTIKEDIEIIAKNMRPADVEEIMASHQIKPEAALQMGLQFSQVCLTGIYKGEPVAMFGLVAVPHCTNTANIWMLGTKRVDEIKISVLRISLKFVKDSLKVFPFIYNFVDVRNTKSIEWLKWLGAKFSEPAPYGAGGFMFQYFHFEEGAKNV